MVQAKNRKDVHLEDEITNGYVRLGAAIVARACEDYVFVGRLLRRFPDDKKLQAEKERLVRFFKNSASFLAPDIDGEVLLEEINRREKFTV